MRSVARGPMMSAPSSLPEPASAMTFAKPSLWPSGSAPPHAAPALELHTGLRRTPALGIGRAADRAQHLVGIDRPAFGTRRELHLEPALRLDDLGDLGVGLDHAAQPGQMLRVGGDQVGVD